jgi:hypothetical protein
MTQVTASRGAVTRRAAAGRGRANASALTATAAHNLPRSAGRAAYTQAPDLLTASDAARPADLRAVAAVSAPSLASVPGTTAHLSPHALPSPLPTELGRWAGGSGGDAPAPSLVGSGREGTDTVASRRTFPSLHGFKFKAGRTRSVPCPTTATPTAPGALA